MSMKVYCRECGRPVELEEMSNGSVGRCKCGQKITAKQDSFGKFYYLYEAPDLGVSVGDGIGADDILR